MLWITPAYAGKSLPAAPVAPGSPDHPRLCGEKFLFLHFFLFFLGSPPPMRGKATPEKYTDQCSRITPAYAGKRCHYKRRQNVCKDHPRLCGEKSRSAVVYGCSVGSPPPMRGKASLTPAAVTQTRITPAYAGKSSRNPFFKN